MKTLLQALVELHPDSSKTTLRSWIEEGRIYVNDQVVRKNNFEVEDDAEITLGRKKERKEQGVTVLFEDDDIIVVNKPSGLLSVAEDVEVSNSLHRILKERVRPKRIYVVHRLDQGTSGVMVFAKNKWALEGLKEQLKGHNIEREYCALVEGRIEEDEGTWESYLFEDKSQYVKETKDENLGQRACSHYKVIKKNDRYSLLSVTLETGRKNQIRVQANSAGHPIAGDKKYGGKSDPFDRLCLHAKVLGFIHPGTKKPMRFEVPMPGKFKGIIGQ
jgi:23S rRNA pseudouridine1911/1915/1917 synthase